MNSIEKLAARVKNAQADLTAVEAFAEKLNDQSVVATSAYLNKPTRSIGEAIRDQAMAKYIERYPDGKGSRHEPTFELSQEFRDYRTKMRSIYNG